MTYMLNNRGRTESVHLAGEPCRARAWGRSDAGPHLLCEPAAVPRSLLVPEAGCPQQPRSRTPTGHFKNLHLEKAWKATAQDLASAASGQQVCSSPQEHAKVRKSVFFTYREKKNVYLPLKLKITRHNNFEVLQLKVLY